MQTQTSPITEEEIRAHMEMVERLGQKVKESEKIQLMKKNIQEYLKQEQMKTTESHSKS